MIIFFFSIFKSQTNTKTIGDYKTQAPIFHIVQYRRLKTYVESTLP